MKLFVILVICVLSIHAQQPNIPTGTQTGLNTFPGQGLRPGTNFNLQGTQRQGMIPSFGGARGFSSPFRPVLPGRRGFATRGFGTPFVRPGLPGRGFAPMSPMQMMFMSLARNPNNYRYATCVFNDTSSSVRGRVDFRQFVARRLLEKNMDPDQNVRKHRLICVHVGLHNLKGRFSRTWLKKPRAIIGEGRQRVAVRIQLAGLPQAVSEVERGIHVHEFGDIGDGCARVGPHFNPMQTPHGSPRNFAMLRHVGNLGNLRQSADGLVSTQFVDSVISLEGMTNIVGRSFVIKFEQDDLGRGTNRESQINGNTINPVACCTIGRTNPRNWYNPLSAQDIQQMAVTGVIPEVTRFDFNNINNPNNQNTNMNGQNNPNNPFNGQPNMNNFNGQPNMNNFNGQPNINTNFNGQPNMNNNNFNPNSGMNNFVPNTGMNNFNQPGNRPANFGAGTFSPGNAAGQTFNFNTQGKK